MQLTQFRIENGLNPIEEHRRLWLAQLGDLLVPLPNFKWRREAIRVHDAHHLVTDYSTSVTGEFQVAAWELGVHCYDTWQARALCRFLMALGLMTTPRRILQAYRRGRAHQVAYQKLAQRGLLTLTLEEVREILDNTKINQSN